MFTCLIINILILVHLSNLWYNILLACGYFEIKPRVYSGIFYLTHNKQFHKCLTHKPILPNSNLEISEIDFHK